jgi:hypothetical protein
MPPRSLADHRSPCVCDVSDAAAIAVRPERSPWQRFHTLTIGVDSTPDCRTLETMNNNDIPHMICRTCRHALDVLVDDDGAHFIHSTTDPDGHDVIPVDPEQGWRGRCDFCSSTSPTHVLPARDFAIPNSPAMSRGNWAACDACAKLLRNDHMDWLLLRIVANFEITNGYPMPLPARIHLANLYRALQLAVTGPIRPLHDTAAPPTREDDHG